MMRFSVGSSLGVVAMLLVAGCSPWAEDRCGLLRNALGRADVRSGITDWVDRNITGEIMSRDPEGNSENLMEWTGPHAVEPFDFSIMGIARPGVVRLNRDEGDKVISVFIGKSDVRGVLVLPVESSEFGYLESSIERFSERVALFCPARD